MHLPGEVCQTLYGLSNKCRVPRCFLSRELLSEAEQSRWKNGGTDEPEEDTWTDELITDILSSLMMTALT